MLYEKYTRKTFCHSTWIVINLWQKQTVPQKRCAKCTYTRRRLRRPGRLNNDKLICGIGQKSFCWCSIRDSLASYLNSFQFCGCYLIISLNLAARELLSDIYCRVMSFLGDVLKDIEVANIFVLFNYGIIAKV